MEWYATFVGLLISGVSGEVLTKVAADRLPKQRSTGVFYQYMACAVLATTFALFSQDVSFNIAFAMVAVIGIVNASGNYFMWQAMGISLSKTALFLPAIGLVPIILAVGFLGEGTLWNWQLGIGALLCFAALWLLSSKPKVVGEERHETWDKKWLLWIALMIGAQGIASFSVKPFSTQMSLSGFLLSWYFFSFVGSIFILALAKTRPAKIAKGSFVVVLLVGVTIMAALAFLNLTYKFGGPISVVQPIYGVAGTLLSVVMGLWVFRERKALTRANKVGFVIGIAGVILVLTR